MMKVQTGNSLPADADENIRALKELSLSGRAKVRERIRELQREADEELAAEEAKGAALKKRYAELEELKRQKRATLYHARAHVAAQKQNINALKLEESKVDRAIAMAKFYEEEIKATQIVCREAQRIYEKGKENADDMTDLLCGAKKHNLELLNQTNVMKDEVILINEGHAVFKKYTPILFLILDTTAEHLPADMDPNVRRQIDHWTSPKLREVVLAPSAGGYSLDQLESLIGNGKRAPVAAKTTSKKRSTSCPNPSKISPEERDQEFAEVVKKRLKKDDSAEQVEKTANTIHGKKVKTIREIQMEQMEKHSVKETAALLRKEQMPAGELKKRFAAMKKDEDLRLARKQHPKIAEAEVKEPRTPPTSPRSRLERDLALSPSPMSSRCNSTSPQKYFTSEPSTSNAPMPFDISSDDDDE